MDLPILSGAVIGLAVLTAAPGPVAGPSKAEGPAALVGQALFASEAPVPRWGEPLHAEDLSLEELGRVSALVTGPDGELQAIVVAVGGLWGWGAQEVELGSERLRLVDAADGFDRLVVDLSADGALPVPEEPFTLDL